MANDLINALVLGLIGGAIPGPILTAVFTEILQSGLEKSFRIIFLGMITETIVATTSLVALSSLHLSESIFRIITIIGAAILIWLATSIWKIHTIDTKKRVVFDNWKIIALILANGALWIFWITVCVPKAILLSQKIRYGDVMFLVLVEVGWLISTSLIAFIFSRFRGWLSNPKIVPFIFKLFAIAFVYFSVTSVYQSVFFFLKK